MTLYLHIGLHKTGTSALQAFLRRNRARLGELGYVYPHAGWIAGAHHNPAYELQGKKRFSAEVGDLQATLAEAATAPNAIVSSEEFEFLEASQVRRLREAIGDTDTRIVIYLRRQDALIGSTFAQQVKMGAKLGDFGAYATASLYAARFDFPQLMLRWGHGFGHENLIVGVICEETSGERLYADFLSRVGLGGQAEGFSVPMRVVNPSPGWGEVELIRRASAMVRGPGRLTPEDMRLIQAAAAATVKAQPALAQTGRLTLNSNEYQRVAQRYGPGNARVAGRLVASPVQANALAFAVEGVAAATPPDEEMLQAAARALALGLAEQSPRFADGLEFARQQALGDRNEQLPSTAERPG